MDKLMTTLFVFLLFNAVSSRKDWYYKYSTMIETTPEFKINNAKANWAYVQKCPKDKKWDSIEANAYVEYLRNVSNTDAGVDDPIEWIKMQNKALDIERLLDCGFNGDSTGEANWIFNQDHKIQYFEKSEICMEYFTYLGDVENCKKALNIYKWLAKRDKVWSSYEDRENYEQNDLPMITINTNCGPC